MNIETIAEILADIRYTGSTIAKEQMLRDNAEEPGLKEVLNFIYDPYFTTGLGKKKLDRMWAHEAGANMSLEEFMAYLRKNTTGTDYDAGIANGFIYSQQTDDAEWLAEGIATKDLKIGVSVTTLNKVFGQGFIPIVGIMRGTLCPEEIVGNYIATEKIDGNRRLIMVRETGVDIYTRSGRIDKGLVEIEEQARQLPSGYVYDTECIAVGDFEDSIELRQASASILNRKGTRRGVKALIFDMLPIAEYNTGRSKFHALGRKALLAAIFYDTISLDILSKHNEAVVNAAKDWAKRVIPTKALTPNIEALPILGLVNNKEAALEIATPIWETGGEGIMLVDEFSVYEVSPNPRKTLLKMKLVNEFVCKCTGVVEGTNKYEGMMGAITVEYQRPGDTNIYEVKVGSGFTDYDRQMYWDYPEKIVGKDIEIESFGESRNQQGEYSLSCPIFKRIVGAKE